MRCAALVVLAVAFVLFACARDESRPTPASHVEASAPSAASAMPPVLKMDREHDQGASAEAPGYSVPATSAVVLDATQMPLALADRRIAVVHVATGPATYSAAWDAHGSITLSPANLKGDDDAGVFSGFRSGQKYVVGVGADVPRDGGKDFMVAWVSVVRVQ
jgi:hypothetical protein